MALRQRVGQFGAAANRVLEVSPDARRAEYYLFLHDDVALDRDCVGLLVASALYQDIEDIVVLIDGAPQIMALAVDG